MAEDLLAELETEGDGISVQEDHGGEALEDGAVKKRSLLARLPKFPKLKKPGKKTLIIGIGILLVIILALGVYVFFFTGDQPSDDGAATPQTEIDPAAGPDGSGATTQAVQFEEIVALPPFERIPLKSGSHLGTISLKVDLELADPRFRKQVVTLETKLAKVVSDELRERTWFELRNPEGKIRLKYELLQRMNRIFPKVTIRNIYFIQFIMQ